MWAKFCGFVLKLFGWTKIGEPVPENKAIILGVPHTSIWDVAVSYLYYTSFGKQKARCMIKKEAFFWPFSLILRAIGGVPVDRTNGATVVRSLISQINESEEFILAIAPEGTRRPVKRWKTGFHTIAKAANIPVYLAYFDYGTKRVGIVCRFELSDDAQADLEKIQAYYESLHLVGKYPKNYITH